MIINSDITTRIFKENFANFLCKGINTFKSQIFLNSIKLANVTLLHKKSRKNLIENDILVNTLPNLSKVFERIMFAQISAYFDKLFSKCQYGFGKGNNTQHWFLMCY